MRKILLLTLVLFVTAKVLAGDTTRIFFVGNSFTYFNDAPSMVLDFANVAGKGMYYQQHTPGGVSVGDIAQDTMAHWRNPSVFNTLREGGWDYVVLQDNQGRFIYNYGTFPPDSVSKVIEGHFKIRDSMKHNSPCSKMILFAGWGPKNGYPPYSSTGFGLIDRIYANYTFLNDSMHEVISPIGKAWERAVVTVPGVDLWGPDSTHPSAAGSYLTAAVIFSSIFKTNPTDLNYSAGIDSVDARSLRQIAWQTVNDSVVGTNLISDVVNISHSADTLIAAGTYASYQWYRNDSFILGSVGQSIIADTNSCYALKAVDTNGCIKWSLPICTMATTNIYLDLNKDGINIFPNPTNERIHIELPVANAIVSIANLKGENLFSAQATGMEIEFPVKLFPNGVYLLTIQTPENTFKKKVVVMH